MRRITYGLGEAFPHDGTHAAAPCTLYDNFNGARKNCDDDGRNASDDDALCVLLWLK